MGVSKLAVEDGVIKTEAGEEIRLTGLNVESHNWGYEIRRNDKGEYDTVNGAIYDSVHGTWTLGSAIRDEINRFNSLFFTENDVVRIHDMGANMIRLQIAHYLLEDMDGTKVQSGWSDLQNWVNLAEKHGMYVVIDMHTPYGGRQYMSGGNNESAQYEGKDLWINPEYQARYLSLWSQIAAEFKDEPGVLFEIMNEPRLSLGKESPESWEALAQQAVDAIRDAGSKNLVIIPNCLDMNSVSHIVHKVVDDKVNDEVEDRGLNYKNPFPSIIDSENNYAYDFHFYNPDEFTHQGLRGNSEYNTYISEEFRDGYKEYLGYADIHPQQNIFSNFTPVANTIFFYKTTNSAFDFNVFPGEIQFFLQTWNSSQSLAFDDLVIKVNGVTVYEDNFDDLTNDSFLRKYKIEKNVYTNNQYLYGTSNTYVVIPPTIGGSVKLLPNFFYEIPEYVNENNFSVEFSARIMGGNTASGGIFGILGYNLYDIEEQIQLFNQFKGNVPLMCLEYGPSMQATKDENHIQWLTDVGSILKKYDIHSAYHMYRGYDDSKTGWGLFQGRWGQSVDNAGEQMKVPMFDEIVSTLQQYFDDGPSNTGPSLGSPDTLYFTDTNANDVFMQKTGDLIGSDPNLNTTLIYGISGGTVSGGISTKVGAYGTLVVTTATGAWTYTPNDAAIEALKTSSTDSFTVTVSDGQASASQAFTVAITGANDPTVFGGASTGNVSEDGILSAAGTLTSSDRDAGDATITTQTGVAGTYGTFTIGTTGSWTYTLNTAAAPVQALRAGQTVTDTFSVATAGGATQPVVITVTGANDLPTLKAPTAPTFTDTAGDDVSTIRTGALVGSDPDAGATLTYGISGGSVSGGISTKVGAYGTLAVTTATGAWTYTPNDAAMEGLTTNATDPFTVTVSDGAASASQPFNVNIVGANDPTIFGGTTTGSVSEDGVLSATGTLTATDRDAGDAAIVAQSNRVGTYGAFSIGTNGVWNYTLNNSAANVQALNAGQSVTDTFAVATAGGATQNMVISIAGLNEVVVNTPPSLAVPTAPTFTDTAGDDTFTTRIGTLVGSDPDAGAVLTYGISGGTVSGGTVTKAGVYGTLAVTTATGAWTYTPNDAAMEGLKTNATDPLTVTVSDGQASASRAFTVAITGANDPTVFGGTITGAVTENSTLTASGTLTATDRDAGDAAIVAQFTTVGTYGMFSIGTNGVWSYSSAANVQALNAGQTVTDTFAVETASGAMQNVVISVSGATPDRINGVLIGDAGHTLATAVNLSGSCSIAGGTGNVGDTDDYFKFVAAAAGTVTLSLSGLSADIDLRLLDSSGAQLTSSTLGGTASESLSSSVVAGATYYIQIDPCLSAASNYSLEVSLPAALDDGSLQTARNLGVLGASKIFNDSIGGIDTADCYAFTMTRKGTFGLLMSGMSSDADVALLNTAGSTLVISQNSGVNDENISRILDPGTYYVKVSPYSGSTNYTLRLGTTALDERFSEHFYLLNNPDVARAVKAGVLISGWQHYALSGLLEGRKFTAPEDYGDFNEDLYLLRNPDVAQVVRAGFLSSGWQHYDLFGRSEGRSYAPPVGYGSFNEDFYLLNNPDVAKAVRVGVLSSGWQHFKLCGQAEGRSYTSPVGYGDFSETYYLLNNPDVARVVQAGYLSSGWQHYNLCGRTEGRSYAEPVGYSDFSEIYYLTNNPDVAAAVRTGIFMTGWQHYRSCGQAEGRSAAGFVLVGYTPENVAVFLGDDGQLHFSPGETEYAVLSEGQTLRSAVLYSPFDAHDYSSLVPITVYGHDDDSASIGLLGVEMASGMI